MSQFSNGEIQHVNIPPSETRSSSSPGGSTSGSPTSPLISLTRHVPQLPEVQLVGISMPACSATSTNGTPGDASAEPIISEPRKNLTTGRPVGSRNSPVLPTSPSPSLFVEAQSCLLHPFIELRGTGSSGDDELFPILLCLDISLRCNSLIYPLIYAH